MSLFRNADVLKIEDGRISGIRATWLTGKIGDTYVKTADIATPKGYQSVKDAEDLDGDALTTQFVFSGKDAEKNPAVYMFVAAEGAIPAGADGTLETENGTIGYTKTGTDAGVLYESAVPSPYEGAYISVSMLLPAGFDGDAEGLLKDAVAGVKPGKQEAPLVAEFKLNFIEDNRWQYLWSGLLVTLEITFFSCLIGIAIGAIMASVRSTWDKNADNMLDGFGKSFLSLMNKITNLYLTIIRGTPAVIQLMISYYVIFTSTRNGVLIAIISFGINSGAYVAEIIRGGIVSLDAGQFEAGRSLGFNYLQTMWYVIIPQAFKNVLPALANEFIVLLKETSVAGYVAVRDLTKGGDIIRGVTYSPFMPLLAVAGI